jgi:hypothetical protein
MNKVLVLVEGQTEERFVKDVLQPHLWTYHVHLEPKIATTKRVKQGPDFKGGITDFQKVENDLRKLLGDSSASLVTTLLDYYGLPDDFPGRIPGEVSRGLQGALNVEQALNQHFAHKRFRAHLTVHEFEALLYAQPEVVAQLLNDPNQAHNMNAERAGFTTPEDINDGLTTHPSRRILRWFPAYQKVLHGPVATARIGLARLRSECPHFDGWLTHLEALGGDPPPQ